MEKNNDKEIVAELHIECPKDSILEIWDNGMIEVVCPDMDRVLGACKLLLLESCRFEKDTSLYRMSKALKIQIPSLPKKVIAACVFRCPLRTQKKVGGA
jgi:hypothetical protein